MTCINIFHETKIAIMCIKKVCVIEIFEVWNCMYTKWHLYLNGFQQHDTPINEHIWETVAFSCHFTVLFTTTREAIPRDNHSIETPSTVDPQWNILYWGSKWNLHTVCWDVVGCEGGGTSVYFGLLVFVLSLVDFLSLLWRSSTNIEIFYFSQNYHLKDTLKIFTKIHGGSKFEWGL